MTKESAAAGPACPAARPGKTKIPAPTIVPTPMAMPPPRPMVRSSSTPPSWTVASGVVSPSSGWTPSFSDSEGGEGSAVGSAGSLMGVRQRGVTNVCGRSDRPADLRILLPDGRNTPANVLVGRDDCVRLVYLVARNDHRVVNRVVREISGEGSNLRHRRCDDRNGHFFLDESRNVLGGSREFDSGHCIALVELVERLDDGDVWNLNDGVTACRGFENVEYGVREFPDSVSKEADRVECVPVHVYSVHSVRRLSYSSASSSSASSSRSSSVR